MSKRLIYESPKGERRRSAPIEESNKAAWMLLESKGWHVVEVLTDDDAPPDFDGLSTPAPEPVGFAAALTTEQLDALAAAGYVTPDAMRKATDAELRAVPGIGPATVRNLRAALAKG